MPSWALAAATAVAAGAFTYLGCVRPMLRDRHRGRVEASGDQQGAASLDDRIAWARGELDRLDQ